MYVSAPHTLLSLFFKHTGLFQRAILMSGSAYASW